jgi:hypothetical protein
MGLKHPFTQGLSNAIKSREYLILSRRQRRKTSVENNTTHRLSGPLGTQLSPVPYLTARRCGCFTSSTDL